MKTNKNRSGFIRHGPDVWAEVIRVIDVQLGHWRRSFSAYSPYISQLDSYRLRQLFGPGAPDALERLGFMHLGGRDGFLMDLDSPPRRFRPPWEPLECLAEQNGGIPQDYLEEFVERK